MYNARIRMIVQEKAETTVGTLGSYYKDVELPFKPTNDDAFFVKDVFIESTKVIYDITNKRFDIAAKPIYTTPGHYRSIIGSFIGWTVDSE